MDISKNICSFYNNRYFDMSQFELILGGKDCSLFFLNSSTWVSYKTIDASQPLFSQVLEQSRL